MLERTRKKVDGNLTSCRGRSSYGHYRKLALTPFPPLGDVPLFEKMFSINVLGDILAVESGYEEGCKWGAYLVLS